AKADLNLVLDKGNPQPLPIAVAPLYGAASDDAQMGSDIASVVAADLERSGLFKPIDRKAFIQSPEALQQNVRFADWKLINAQALVSGKVEKNQTGGLRVEFRLWDVFAEQQMIGQALNATPQGWRRIAHMIADAVYKRITGEEGYFDTQ